MPEDSQFRTGRPDITLPPIPLDGAEKLRPIPKELLTDLQKRSSLEMMARLAQGNLDPNSPFNPEAPIDLSKSVESASAKLTQQVDKERKSVWEEFDKFQSESNAQWERMTDEQKQEVRMQTYVESQIGLIWPQLKDNPNTRVSLKILGLDLAGLSEDQAKEAFAKFLKASKDGNEDTLYDRFFKKGKNSAHELLQVFAKDAKRDDVLDGEEFARNVDAIKPLIVGLFGQEQAFSAFSAVADLNATIANYPNVFKPDFLKRCSIEEIGLGKAGVPEEVEKESLDYLAGKITPLKIDFPITEPGSPVGLPVQPAGVSDELPAGSFFGRFELTDEWQEVPDDYVLEEPAEVRLDMSPDGKRYARKLQGQPQVSLEGSLGERASAGGPPPGEGWVRVYLDSPILFPDEEVVTFGGEQYVRPLPKPAQPISEGDQLDDASAKTVELRNTEFQGFKVDEGTLLQNAQKYLSENDDVGNVMIGFKPKMVLGYIREDIKLPGNLMLGDNSVLTITPEKEIVLKGDITWNGLKAAKDALLRFKIQNGKLVLVDHSIKLTMKAKIKMSQDKADKEINEVGEHLDEDLRNFIGGELRKKGIDREVSEIDINEDYLFFMFSKPES